MKSLGKAILYGFLVWLIPFIVGMGIFPLKQAGNPLFETIMPIVLVVCGMVFAALYFKNIGKNFVREGIVLGIIWFVMSVGIDLLMFMWGPMKMTFAAYMGDIGLTYLIYPAVTIGVGVITATRPRE